MASLCVDQAIFMKRKRELYQDFELMQLDCPIEDTGSSLIPTALSDADILLASNADYPKTNADYPTINADYSNTNAKSAAVTDFLPLLDNLLCKRQRIFDHMFITLNPEHSQMVLYKPLLLKETEMHQSDKEMHQSDKEMHQSDMDLDNRF